MSGDIECGVCDICKNKRDLKRTYYRYDIKCECHSPQHFELVCHCKNCTPIEPTETKVILRTNNLTKL